MKNLFIILILNICTSSLYAAIEVKGQIITKTDTINATLLIPVYFMNGDINFVKLQNKIKYLADNKKKHKLKPSQAEQITFRFGGEKIKLLSRNNYFMNLLKSGHLKLFQYYYTSPNFSGAPGQSGGMTVNIQSYYYLQKGDGEMKRVHGFSFKKDIGDYLSDCPDVAEQVESRELRKKDIEQIVKNYNKLCTEL
jgi:hypothetical protein